MILTGDGALRSRAAVLLVLALTAAPACLFRRIAVHALADALASGGDAFASEDDPDLVRDAAPFALKTIESLLSESPDNPGLLLAACRGFTQYAYAFVQTDADAAPPPEDDRQRELRARALRLYLRARDYGLRGLEIDHPGIRQRLMTDPQAALAAATAREVPLLYWTGAAWGAAISQGKDRPDLVVDVPAVKALMMRALELDETFERGAIHVAMISLETLPGAMGGSVDRARGHYRRAVELSGGLQVAPHVSLAENVSVSTQNRAEFVEMLDEALAVDPDRDPGSRLANRVAQRRARALLSRVDDLFL